MTTLLYVDDERTIGKVVERFFTRRGDVALIAHSIAEAQAILEHHAPSIVFIDVWLGRESGFELLDWIGEHHPHLCKRVTFVTGELVDAHDAGSRWRDMGRPCIQKPFALACLAESVDGAEIRDVA